MDNSEASIPRNADVRRAGDMLFAALAARHRLFSLPGDAPATLEEAYAVQSVVVAAAGPVGGWKVSPLKEGDAPRCSPIPRSFFSTAPSALDAGLLGSSQAELEIAVRLGSELAPGPSAEEVAAAIGSVHPAVELLSSRFAADSPAPDFHRLADLQNCAAVIIGEGQTDWRNIEFADLALELTLDNQVQASTQPRPSTAQTLASIGWLATHAHQRGQSLKAGDIIITGARVGPVPVAATGTIVGRVGPFREITISRR